MDGEFVSPQILGTWRSLANIPSGERSGMMLNAKHLHAHWRRNSLSSDFWSHYGSELISEDAEEGMLDQEALDNILSYMHNELFENCAKFSSGEQLGVHYQAWQSADGFVFQFRNYIESKKQDDFVALIEELLSSDLDELYFAKLEESVELGKMGSGLGYLTLMKDYGIQLGFCFTEESKENVSVDVQVRLSMKDIL